ncbi:MAG: glycoside hydrolase family 97 catalytic domain-containing protein [Chitinophagaceae bacterium]
MTCSRTGFKIFLLFVVCRLCISNALAQVTVHSSFISPDKKTTFQAGIGTDKKLMYRVLLSGQEIVRWSPLGLLTNELSLGENTTIKSSTQKTVSGGFDWPLGENAYIDNSYTEFQLECTSGSKSFALPGRVYNRSVAFRYHLPLQSQSRQIKKELTAFNLPGNYTIYQYHHESVYTPGSIDTFNTPSDLPSTLTNGKNFLVIGEAMNENYTKAELKRGEMTHSLAIAFLRDTVVKATGDFLGPWRTISISNTAIGLHDFSELNLKLNPAPKGGVPAWIKPGKLIRAQLNTRAGIDCIDFAAKQDFQYIMFDAGWYGPETRTSSNPAIVIPQMDLPKIIAYGKEKGIGVILYVNYVGLKEKLDSLLPIYKKWGIKGFKFGFVDGISQKGIVWLKDAIEKVNDAGFILDIHDNYKPTGLSRTYPALLTQEGIRGDENSPDAFHTTTLPFTRFLAGPADFTFCYPNGSNKYEKNLKVSMAQQLALTVIYFSPLQSMMWYGIPTEYTNEEEVEFFKLVPTVWDESHYLAGDIGKHISVARRKGRTWFVGTAAGFGDLQSRLTLNFLEKNKVYTATVYEDSGNGSISKRTFAAKRGDVFPLNIKAKGGQAIVFR